MKSPIRLAGALLVSVFLAGLSGAAVAQDNPNIVLVFMDNFGWGELGTYGGGVLRGAPTPRIDSLAEMDLSAAEFPPEARYGGKAANLARLQRILDGRVNQLIKDGFKPDDIAVISCRGMQSTALADVDQIGKCKVRRFTGNYSTNI